MVQPFASLVRFPTAGTPRLLINRERRGESEGMDFDHPDSGKRDGLFLGDCDEGARGLASLLGWELTTGEAAAEAAVAAAAVASAPPPSSSKMRLGLTRSGTAKAAESVVLVPPTYADILSAAANKLKLPSKSIKRLVLLQSVHGHPAGTVIPAVDAAEGGVAAYLKNDALIWVSTSG